MLDNPDEDQGVGAIFREPERFRHDPFVSGGAVDERLLQIPPDQREVEGSRINLDSGPLAAIQLGDELALATGAVGKQVFLVGFWCAVFSSLLGVWQSVPYIFADLWRLKTGRETSGTSQTHLQQTPAYRLYLVGLTLVPLPMLWGTVKEIQILYAVMGALFMPLLALTLLIMNNRSAWVGERFRNGPLINALLGLTILFFLFAAALKLYTSVT